MCGIFGAVIDAESPLQGDAQRILEQLFLLSETRGKEAAGVAMATDGELLIHKEPVAASKLIRSPSFRAALREGLNGRASKTRAFIGHSRLMTDGGTELARNNQPVVAPGIVGIHNGIIVNHGELWAEHGSLERKCEVDSEVIFALLRSHLDSGADLAQATARTFGMLEGAASVAALFEDRDELLLATNNGSLYFQIANDQRALVFASESYILRQLTRQNGWRAAFAGTAARHVEARAGLIVAQRPIEARPFELHAAPQPRLPIERHARRRRLIDRSPPDRATVAAAASPNARADELARVQELFPYRPNTEGVRCTRCVLPATMPFIDFDAQGVCSYCKNYQAQVPLGREALEAVVKPHRRGNGTLDCVVGLSGGRDSTYGLHYLKTELGMNPVAYTYDWGMVTDLARRNISRICGKLGVEHILVSADIGKKRSFIKKNVEAWLARPSLGTIPLFMAGDKAYFHYLRQVTRQVEQPLAFLCENLLERTDFKTGFAGVRPAFFDRDHVYTMSLANKLRLLGYFGGEFARNPKYLNTSLIDSALAFRFYYLAKKSYHNIYRYIQWNEQEVTSTLLGTYDFELAEDTQSTWRIGDGTAAFYNLIYFTVAGFTENDTFRSNQVREGCITREAALKKVHEENRPRFATIRWYLETIGLGRSLERVVRTVNAIPKLSC